MEQFTINPELTQSPFEVALNAKGLTPRILELVQKNTQLALRLEGEILFVSFPSAPSTKIDATHVMSLMMSCTQAERIIQVADERAAKTPRDLMLEEVAKNTGLNLG